MARWTRDEVLNQPADFVQFMMEDFLTKNGFRKKDPQGTGSLAGRRWLSDHGKVHTV